MFRSGCVLLYCIGPCPECGQFQLHHPDGALWALWGGPSYLLHYALHRDWHCGGWDHPPPSSCVFGDVGGARPQPGEPWRECITACPHSVWYSVDRGTLLALCSGSWTLGQEPPHTQQVSTKTKVSSWWQVSSWWLAHDRSVAMIIRPVSLYRIHVLQILSGLEYWCAIPNS